MYKRQVFDEALAAYNAKKTKTRDKIPDYYEPVSYTHLDVYKRQTMSISGRVNRKSCSMKRFSRSAK